MDKGWYQEIGLLLRQQKELGRSFAPRLPLASRSRRAPLRESCMGKEGGQEIGLLLRWQKDRPVASLLPSGKLHVGKEGHQKNGLLLRRQMRAAVSLSPRPPGGRMEQLQTYFSHWFCLFHGLSLILDAGAGGQAAFLYRKKARGACPAARREKALSS